jgi:hypothetical protein
MLHLKIFIYFYKKNLPKSFYLIIICNIKNLQDGYKKVKFYVKNYKKMYVGSETDPVLDTGTKPTEK